MCVYGHIATFISRKIPANKTEEVEKWLKNFPNQEAQEAIATFLVCAQEADKLDVGLEVLDGYWESDFQYPHPDIRGSHLQPKARFIYESLYRDTGISPPELKPLDNSEYDGRLIVKTQNSTYCLESKPQEGLRTIIRERDNRTWSGHLIHLEVGKRMIFDIIEGKGAGALLETSKVASIDKTESSIPEHVYLVHFAPPGEEDEVEDIGEVNELMKEKFGDLARLDAKQRLQEYYGAMSTERNFYVIRKLCEKCGSDKRIFCNECWEDIFNPNAEKDT